MVSRRPYTPIKIYLINNKVLVQFGMRTAIS
jgi:hypothetical protein